MQFSPSVILSLNIGTQAAQAGWLPLYLFGQNSALLSCLGIRAEGKWESQVCASGPMSNYLLKKEIESKQLVIIVE